jgi:ribosomal protein S18 acetylase RimI-like enzyme
MEVISLNQPLESRFWKHVNRDIPHYFFFALDWKHSRKETKILLALKKKRIDGMMLIFNDRFVQLRGSIESVNALLKKLDLEKVELQALWPHRHKIIEKYKSAWSHELMLMTLKKGEERLYMTHPIVTLEESDAEQIAEMITRVNPESWGDITTDAIVEGMSNTIWIGIKMQDELVSIGRMRLAENVGHIPTVATHEAYRNKGYATSIVSHLVKMIFKETPLAILYVLSDNPSAIRVYKKVGFKPYRKYFFMKGEKR